MMYGFIIIILILLITVGLITNKHDAERVYRTQQQEAMLRKSEYENWRKVGVVNSYDLRNMLKIAYQKPCPICNQVNLVVTGNSNSGGSCYCPTCTKRFLQDEKDGLRQYGITMDNRAYNFVHYYALRLIEHEFRNGLISEKEMCEKRQALIDAVALSHETLVSPKERPEEPIDISYRDDYLS